MKTTELSTIMYNYPKMSPTTTVIRILSTKVTTHIAAKISFLILRETPIQTLPLLNKYNN
jgi:hypothetical protein